MTTRVHIPVKRDDQVYSPPLRLPAPERRMSATRQRFVGEICIPGRNQARGWKEKPYKNGDPHRNGDLSLISISK